MFKRQTPNLFYKLGLGILLTPNWAPSWAKLSPKLGQILPRVGPDLNRSWTELSPELGKIEPLIWSDWTPGWARYDLGKTVAQVLYGQLFPISFLKSVLLQLMGQPRRNNMTFDFRLKAEQFLWEETYVVTLIHYSV